MAKIKSWRTCPKCSSRTTKIVHITDDGKPPIECQMCEHRYDYPEVARLLPEQSTSA